MGPSVNLAARLMGKAKHGSIVLDVQAYKRSRRQCLDFTFEELRPVRAKGYAEPVQVFEPKLNDDEEVKLSEMDTIEMNSTKDVTGRKMVSRGSSVLQKSSVGDKIEPIVHLFECVPSNLFERFMSLSSFQQIVLKIASVVARSPEYVFTI
jgi:hypothetical protein